MKKNISLSLLIATMSFTMVVCGEEISTAAKIIQKADEARILKNCGFILQIVEFAKNEGKIEIIGNTRCQASSRVFGFHQEEYRCIFFFLFPERFHGRKILMREHCCWLYPAEGQGDVVRIPPGHPEFVNIDVSLLDVIFSNYTNHYTSEMSAEEDLTVGKETKLCYKLELIPKDNCEPFSKLIYWVEKANCHPVKVEHYGYSGKLWRTAYYRDFKMAMGRLRSHEIFIIWDSGRVFRVLYSHVKEEQLSEDLFVIPFTVQDKNF